MILLETRKGEITALVRLHISPTYQTFVLGRGEGVVSFLESSVILASKCTTLSFIESYGITSMDVFPSSQPQIEDLAPITVYF